MNSSVFQKLRKPALRVSLLGIGLGAVGFLSFLLLDRLYPVQPLLDAKPFSLAVTDKDGRLLRAYLTPDDQWRLAFRAGRAPGNVRRLLVAVEDRYFYSHPGVNPFSFLRAFWENLRAGRVVYGGSTITMQLARVLEPKPRTLRSKLVEVFRAFQLEKRFTKEEILAQFLNITPYGGNVEGLETASRLYFQKPPEQLTLGEAGLLVIVPNKPNRYRLDAHLPEAIAARDRAFRRLLRQGLLTEKEFREAVETRYEVVRKDFPRETPHLADRILMERRFHSGLITSRPNMKKFRWGVSGGESGFPPPI